MNNLSRETAYWLISRIQKIKNPSIIIQHRAKCTLKSKFEGANKLSPKSYFSGEMGYGSYIGTSSIVVGKIGRYCSIADDVVFLTKTHPVTEMVSTHPCFYSTKKQSGFTYVYEQCFNEEPLLPNSEYSIEIGNDVYIGYGVKVIGPCRVGNGAVIAAGAVVTGDVPDYAIYGGVPAKLIKYRFSAENIAYLLSLKWWDKPKEWLAKYANDFKSIEQLKQSIQKDLLKGRNNG